MYLGTREARRPKGPARLKGILERRETILSKWRDGRTFSLRSFYFVILHASSSIPSIAHIYIFVQVERVKRRPKIEAASSARSAEKFTFMRTESTVSEGKLSCFLAKSSCSFKIFLECF